MGGIKQICVPTQIGDAYACAALIKNDRLMAKSKPRIVVVDDDVSVRKALVRLLEASSYEVQSFESAYEFINSVSQNIPECLIVDLQMPNMTGMELQQHLAHSGIKIPIVVITAHDEPGSRERCIAAGAAAYLQKPIRKSVLFAAIDAAIGMSH